MDAYICDAIRTPIGCYGGILSSLKPDDLAVYVPTANTNLNIVIQIESILVLPTG